LITADCFSCSNNARRKISPTKVFANSVLNSSNLGTLYGGKRRLQAVSSEAHFPGSAKWLEFQSASLEKQSLRTFATLGCTPRLGCKEKPILKLTHSSLFVHDQEEALKFYRDVLGMEVRADFTNGNFRWLTVGPTSQPDFELVLMATTENHALSADSAKAAQALLNSGQMSSGVFQTDDAMRDYEA
jgi:Glyoxalase/Bleomycin resistance protein/Dioxygenase superfamily